MGTVAKKRRHTRRELDRLAGKIARLRAHGATLEVTERLYQKHARLTRKLSAMKCMR